MEQNTLTCFDALPATSTRFCAERYLPTFRSSNLPNLTWLLTWSRLKSSGPPFPPRFPDVPTRLSNRDCFAAVHESAFGPKQRWPSALHMSAFGGKADMATGAEMSAHESPR